MSILSVDQIQPIGSGTTITLNATEVKTGTEITVGTGASIFSPAGNTLTFGTNNVERVRIKNDGSVGIGTNNPTNYGGSVKLALHNTAHSVLSIVAGTSSDSSILFADGTSGDATYRGNVKYAHSDDSMRFSTAAAERLRIDSSGRLLVGTSSSSNAVRAVFQGYPGGGSNFQARVQFQTNQATNLSADHHLANLLFTNASNSVGAQIDVKADAAWGTNDYPGRIEFKTTADGANSPTERLRIGSAGQIGLGGANYGSSGQVLTSQGSGSAPQWATPSSVTTAGGTMTIGFQDHTSGNVSSTTATGYYQRIGNMVFATVDTGSINKSGLQSGQILLLTGCFPVTRDNNWTISGSCSHYNVNSAQNGGGHVVVPQKGYWLSNTSLYFTIPRNNSTADNLTVGMMSGNNARFFLNWSYKVA